MKADPFTRRRAPNPWLLRSATLAVSCAVAALAAMGNAACSGAANVHDTAQASGEPCVTCHMGAYDNVKTPKHVGVYPTTCEGCHNTNAWVPASGGHPEAKFPITTGSHANKGITCTDCHIASRGSDALGANTDCIHCHLGAHNEPSIDSAHTTVSSYTPATDANPHSCLTAGCHPSG